MQTKIILLLALLTYSVVVGQSYMYIIALKNVQNGMGANSYIEFRKLLDLSFRTNFKFVVYVALLTNLLLLIAAIKNPGSLLFVTAAIAFVALIVDVLLMTKGNMPINNLINTWTIDNYPTNWTDYRARWLTVFQYRQVTNIAGFVSLAIAAVFGIK